MGEPILLPFAAIATLRHAAVKFIHYLRRTAEAGCTPQWATRLAVNLRSSGACLLGPPRISKKTEASNEPDSAEVQAASRLRHARRTGLRRLLRHRQQAARRRRHPRVRADQHL